MERWEAKVIALVVLFLTVLIATLLPIKVTGLFERQGERGERWISYLMCFGGGVFLSTFGLHMGPDVRAIFQHAILEPYGIDYPVADLVILLGLFLMLFLDKVMDKVQKKQKAKGWTTENVCVIAEEQNGDPNSKKTETEFRSEKGTPAEVVPLNSSGSCTVHVPNGSTVSVAHDVPEIKSPRSMLLLLALSMDHIFEGMSVGLKHSITSVWNLSLAIIAHEVIIAFSLGMRLVKTYDSLKKILIAAIICSAMEPLGVAIGMVLMETGAKHDHRLIIVNGVLQAMSTGVFMYATFFEILRDELHGNTSITKLCFMLFGFTVLALMGLIPEGDLFEDETMMISNTTMQALSWETTDVYELT